MCVQDASGRFAATVSEGATDAMYIALKQAIAGHSPAIVPPASKPLVLAGPFGAACHKGELLRWLLREHGDKLALPEMVTTKARGNAADTSATFKVKKPLLAQGMLLEGSNTDRHAPHCRQMHARVYQDERDACTFVQRSTDHACYMH